MEKASYAKQTIALLSASLLIMSLIVMQMGEAFASSSYEVYRAVKISDYFLQGVSGMITTKSVAITTHHDYFVYVNFDGEDSSIGSGYFVGKDVEGNTIYWNLIYSKIGGGYLTHDTYTSVPIGYTFLADVKQTSNGSNCYKATTYNSNNKTICLSPTTTSASLAGAIMRANGAYSSTTNQGNGLMDYLKEIHYNGGYKALYFTDDQTNESKCQSLNSYVEDDLLKRAPDGFSSNKFDKIGFGPTLYTSDDCISNSYVWSPYGDS